VDLSSRRKKSVGKQDTRRIGVHPLVKVRPPREKIHNGIRGFWDMLQCVVKILQELDPPGLAARDFLQFSEVLEVFVVSADMNWMLSTKEEWTATFEAKDHSKELLVMGVVVGFGQKEAAGVESDRVEPVVIFLGDDYSQGVA
jgi:hypothetical protein